MNKKQFKQYLENPSVLSSTDTKKLSLLLDDYPYFQTARMLYVKGLKTNNDDRYEQSLQLAAACAINRSKLYDFLAEEEQEIVVVPPQKEETPTVVQQETETKEVIEEPQKEEQSEEVSITEDEAAKETESIVEEVQNEPIAQEQTETAEAPDNVAEEEPVQEFESKETEEIPDNDAMEIVEEVAEIPATQDESEQQTESTEPETEETSAEVVVSEEKPEVEQVCQEEPATEPVAEPAESLADQILRKYRAMQEQAQTTEAKQSVATPADSLGEEQSQEPVAESHEEQAEPIEAAPQEADENESPLSFSVIDFVPSAEPVAEPVSENPVADGVQEEVFIEFTETVENSESRNIVGQEIPAESEKTEPQPVEEFVAPESHDWYERSEKKAEAHAMNLIDAFISLNYKTPIKTEADEKTKEFDVIEQKELLKAGEEEHEYATETMAKIYAKQRHFDKAIAIYEKLSLKFPQKSIYFADRIKELTELKK